MPTLFQSTPANTGGRCHRRQREGCGLCWFQSTPANTGGRCDPQAWRGAHFGQFQSTPANTGGRCSTTLLSVYDTIGFNPRPPILAGDAARDCWPARPYRVSIHARQYWRAMPWASDRVMLVALFQSTPANTGGRCWPAVRSINSAMEFQSTPANTGGRCPCRAARSSCPRCFNPRPPILAGDAVPRGR